jgi:hypothetical protein
MWPTIAGSAIAVLGTLLGGITASRSQARASTALRAETRADQRRDEQLRAVVRLLEALDEHRHTMWRREQARLTDADQAVLDRALDASAETRKALSGPMALVRILVPALAALAQEAAAATFQLRQAKDEGELDELRATAKTAAEQLADAAGTHFA